MDAHSTCLQGRALRASVSSFSSSPFLHTNRGSRINCCRFQTGCASESACDVCLCCCATAAHRVRPPTPSSTPGAWLIFIALLFVLSFPPVRTITVSQRPYRVTSGTDDVVCSSLAMNLSASYVETSGASGSVLRSLQRGPSSASWGISSASCFRRRTIYEHQSAQILLNFISDMHVARSNGSAWRGEESWRRSSSSGHYTRRSCARAGSRCLSSCASA